VSAADPLNLIGILTPGPRLPALMDNRVIYRDGLPVATLSGGKVDFLTTLDDDSSWEAEKAIDAVRRPRIAFSPQLASGGGSNRHHPGGSHISA